MKDGESPRCSAVALSNSERLRVNGHRLDAPDFATRTPLVEPEMGHEGVKGSFVDVDRRGGPFSDRGARAVPNTRCMSPTPWIATSASSQAWR